MTPRRHGPASAVGEAFAVIVPSTCAGCSLPGRAVCVDCEKRMTAGATRRDLAPGFPVWMGTEYADVARRAILALKNDQRTDVAASLAPVLLRAIDAAVLELSARPGAPHVISLAALPSSRSAYRRRGYRPIDVVVRKTGLLIEHPLVWKRQPADQIGLTFDERKRNLAGSLRHRGRVTGRSFLLLDDVVTTGATLLESRRALVAAGASVFGAAVLAGTGKRVGRVGDEFPPVE